MADVAPDVRAGLLGLAYPANSSQLSAGSVQVMPLVPHQCCGPPIFTVAFAGGTGFDTEAATDWPAWLDTSINGVAIMTAEKPTPSSRFISILSEELDRGTPFIRLRIARRNSDR